VLRSWRFLDYKNGKPSPDAFLFSAGRLGLAPGVCLVFDDTDLGIETATAAGRASLRVPFPQKETEEPTHSVRLDLFKENERLWGEIAFRPETS
jgi:beta-phosphoglucomutase-like phosphatase (HAD superfamily)